MQSTVLVMGLNLDLSYYIGTRFTFLIPLYFKHKTTITISDFFRLPAVFERAEFNGIF